MKFAPGKGVQEGLFEKVGSMKLGVVSFKETTSGLEDAYLSLVKETL